MCLFSDDPVMQGLALFGNGGLLLSHTPPNFTPGSYEVLTFPPLFLRVCTFLLFGVGIPVLFFRLVVRCC